MSGEGEGQGQDMGVGLKVWVTRAQPGAGETARRLTALGHTPIIAPVLEVRALAEVTVDLTGVGALAFTSANGVRVFAGLCGERDLPVFAVGDATASAASAAGFTRVDSAAGDVADLARRIIERTPIIPCILHPCALQQAGDLVGALAGAGLSARSLPIYQTCAVSQLPEPIALALDRLGQAGPPTLDVVLIHSPRAARTVAELLATLSGLNGLAHVRAIGLSAACLVPLDPLPFASATPAAHPDEVSLLSPLGPQP